MQFVPSSLLEGGKLTDDQDHDNYSPCPLPQSYIPNAPALSKEVATLHYLARIGLIPPDTAERQINTYLIMPSASGIASPHLPTAWLRMPLADAPHHSTMPDLGAVLHSVIIREPSTSAIGAVIEQCIPRFRHPTRPVLFTDSQPLFLALVMGLLLGLYSGSVKKPGFRVRACIFARLRAVMTASPEEQTQFCTQNEPLILFACMEYMARIPPIYMPVHSRVLTEGDPHVTAFYRRIPPLADELRQWVDQEECPAWCDILTECGNKMERITRLKRGGHSCPSTSPAAPSTLQSHKLFPGQKPITANMTSACWNTPRLGPCPTVGEFTLLGMDLGVPGHIIQRIQQELHVAPLPSNLRAMQVEAIKAKGRARCRASFMQTHWPICAQCMLTHKPCTVVPGRLQMRLDTLSRSLVCATCLGHDIVYVNLLGRTMLFRKTTFYVCPTCVTIQPYTSTNQQPWTPTRDGVCWHKANGLVPATAKHGQGKPRAACCVCKENAQMNTIHRVDHLTGLMVEFHYCQRHAPRADAARRCVNARQLDGLELRSARTKR